MKVSVWASQKAQRWGRTMVRHWGPRKGPGKGTLWALGSVRESGYSTGLGLASRWVSLWAPG